MALQPSWRPIGVRTFRNRGATHAGNHPISGMAPVFPATHAGKHPIFGMAHGFSCHSCRKTPHFRHGSGFFGMAREFFPKAVFRIFLTINSLQNVDNQFITECLAKNNGETFCNLLNIKHFHKTPYCVRLRSTGPETMFTTVATACIIKNSGRQ